MNQLIDKTLHKFQQELLINYEVHHLVRDMVETVSQFHLQNDYYRMKENFEMANGFNQKLIQRIEWIEKEYGQVKGELSFVKGEATMVRQRFVNQIGSFLAENRINHKLKKRVMELEEILSTIKENEEIEESEEVANGSLKLDNPREKANDNSALKTDSKDKISAPPSPPKPKNPLKLLALAETPLLHIFSFLQTVEVLSYAQVCRYVYQRMDKIFGIDSTTVKPEWAALPPPPVAQPIASPIKPASVDTVVNPVKVKTDDGLSDVKLTREVVDELTKRLTPQQMKLILSIAEKLKKQASMIELLNDEKEDINSRLQNTESIRDFLIEKLKTAELAIKSMMNEVSTLKKQSASDSEIVSYLDLKVQDLEGQLLEANHRCSHLQASLELQVNSLSLKEEQLTAELNEWKDKYEKMEANYKSQKKILVKEVKLLRGKVEELSQEKTLNSARMQKLKEALELSNR